MYPGQGSDGQISQWSNIVTMLADLFIRWNYRGNCLENRTDVYFSQHREAV
jgi:hypothetical protein